MCQLQDIVVTAPVGLREQLAVSGTRRKAALCRNFRPDLGRLSDPVQAAKFTLKSLAQRIEQLDAEVSAIDARLDELVSAAPMLVSRVGIGTWHAAQFLTTAWSRRTGGTRPRSIRRFQG